MTPLLRVPPCLGSSFLVPCTFCLCSLSLCSICFLFLFGWSAVVLLTDHQVMCPRFICPNTPPCDLIWHPHVPPKVLSWNTHGLNSAIKHSLVFQFIKKHNPHVCVLQGTHLVRSKTLSLKKPWVGHHYHSTYSNFARGVSVLVLKNLPFKLLDLILDPEGRFVMVYALIHNIPWVLVGLYLLPCSNC